MSIFRISSMRKLLLYIRASREDLKMNPEGTLTSQRQRLEEYVRSRNVVTPGWGKIVGAYMDEARSAKDTNRPQFQEMLRAIELHKGDTILVTELSRLSRSMKDFCAIWDFFRAHKAQFLSLRESFDTTTAAGEMMVYSIMNFAQFERKQTSERVAANFQARAMRGLHNGGYPILGYDSDPERKGHLIVNESEAYQVRRIFQVFQEKGSLKVALDQLTAEGIKSKRRVYQDGRIKEGKNLTLNALWGMLRNRHYIGDREIHKRFRNWNKERVPEGKEYQTTKASWPAIVPSDLFHSVQETLNWNQKKYRPEDRKNFDYFFSSILYCGECGQSMVGRSGKTKNREKHFYYAHKTKKTETRQTKGCDCRWYSIDAPEFHKIMRNRFKRLAEEPAFVRALYDTAVTDHVALIPENERRIAILEAEAKELHQQITNLMDTLQSTTAPVVRDLITKELETKGTALKVKTDEQNTLQAQSGRNKATTVEPDEFSKLAKDWDKIFSKLTTTERKQFIRTFLGKIEVFPDRFRVRYNYDQRMVARALNVLDLSAHQNSSGAGPSGPAPGSLFSKKDQRASYSNVICNGRGDTIRTCDPLVPNQMR